MTIFPKFPNILSILGPALASPIPIMPLDKIAGIEPHEVTTTAFLDQFCPAASIGDPRLAADPLWPLAQPLTDLLWNPIAVIAAGREATLVS